MRICALWPYAAAAFIGSGVLAIALPVCATPVTLGSASTYGVLIGARDKLSIGGGLTVSGDLGFGQNSTVSINRTTNSVEGDVYEDSGITVSGSGSVNVSGNIYTQSMAQAISDASNASSSAAALAATAGLVDQGRGISLNGGSLTIKALTNLSENVLDISSLSLTNGTLTFDDNGFDGAKFIVNVTGGFSVNSTGSLQSIIEGLNGASPSDIIFNIEGTGSTVSITGNSSNQIIGTILAPARNVTLGGGGSLVGNIVAGVSNAGKSYTVQTQSSGFNITSYGYQPSAGGGSKVPEPSSLALFGAGVAILIFVHRYRTRLGP